MKMLTGEYQKELSLLLLQEVFCQVLPMLLKESFLVIRRYGIHKDISSEISVVICCIFIVFVLRRLGYKFDFLSY